MLKSQRRRVTIANNYPLTGNTFYLEEKGLLILPPGMINPQQDRGLLMVVSYDHSLMIFLVVTKS